MTHKDFTLAYGGAGYYHASLTEDPEYGTPFVVKAASDEQAWEKLKKLIDAESCVNCGKFIKDSDEYKITGEGLVCDCCNKNKTMKTDFIERLKAKEQHLSNNYPYPIFREERQLLARIRTVLAMRYSITRKNAIPKYRPYTLNEQLTNPL